MTTNQELQLTTEEDAAMTDPELEAMLAALVATLSTNHDG